MINQAQADQPSDYDHLCLVAKEVYGTIITTDNGSVMYHQAMDRQFAVLWVESVKLYLVKSPVTGNNLFTAAKPEQIVIFIGDRPPYEYVERVYANGRSHQRIFSN